MVMLTAFVDMIGFALVLPLLPLYAQEFGAEPFTIGCLLSSFAFAQLATSPLWGRLSDRIGRRPVILAGQAFSAVAFLFFAAADSVWLLLLSRLAQGAGGGTLSANSAYVADVAEPELRAKALGWITAATSAGVMVGPAVASLTVRYSTAAPGLIAAGLCVVNLLIAWRWLPETSVGATAEGPVEHQPIWRSVIGVIRRPTDPAHAVIWIYSVGMVAFMAVASMIGLYLADRFGLTKETIGAFYVLTGSVSVLMRAVVLGNLVAYLGEVRVLRLGAVALSLGLFLPPQTEGPLQFALAIIFIPVGTALLFTCATSLISRYSDPATMGQALGVQQAFGGTGRLLAPIWAGAAYQHVGPAAPFAIAAALVFLAALFSLRLRSIAHVRPSGESPLQPSEAAVGGGGEASAPPPDRQATAWPSASR